MTDPTTPARIPDASTPTTTEPHRTWQRYVAIGDSFTEGMCDPQPEPETGYVGWADRLAGHLAAHQRLVPARGRLADVDERPDHRQRAERAEALGIDIRLGNDEREILEQRVGKRRPALPARKGPVGHAPVHQNLRDMATAEFQDGHRPDFGFGDDRQIRLPIVQEPADGRLEIKRDILVDDRRPQAFGDDARRGHRPGRQYDVDAAPPDFLDHRDDGVGLADACRMEPHQGALRPRLAGMAVALAATRRILLALRGANGKVGPDEGIDGRADPAVAGERQPRAKAAHDSSPSPAVPARRDLRATGMRVNTAHPDLIGISRFPGRADGACGR